VVPNVSGQTFADAQALLAAGHCTLGSVGTAFSTLVPKNRVISQNVPAGTQLANGSAVSVVVSLGPKPKKPPAKMTVCYRRHTLHVTKKVAAKLRKHGAKLGACRKKKH
jgi:beta-lactam-binding protein with PASTA domain